MRRAGTVALLLLSAAAAGAQTTGAIAGSIVDAGSGAPVAGVVVIASSPSLQGEQTARSGADGRFQIALLPPGRYTLNVQAPGYQAFTREGLELHAAQVVQVPMSIREEGVAGALFEIAPPRPLLAAGSTATGGVVSREQFELIPYGREQRSFEQAALSVPGVLPDALVQLLRTPSIEPRTIVDGLDITDPRTNRQATRLSQNFVQEVGVATGGLPAEIGRALGGVVSVATRSGGNEIHGSVFAEGLPFELPRRTPAAGAARYAASGGFEVGGPIQRDKLWFYAGFAPQFADSPEGVSQAEWQYIGKLSWRASEEHRLALEGFGNPGAAGANDLALRYLGNILDGQLQVEAAAGLFAGAGSDRLQAALTLGNFLPLAGRHQLRYGGEVERESAGDAHGWSLAAFAQDNWSPLQGLFLDLGVRVERQRVFFGPGLDVTTWLPRIGLAYDVTGRGMSRIYAAFARYARQLPLPVAPLPASLDLREMSTDAWSAGAEIQTLRDIVAGVEYTHTPVYNGATLALRKPFSGNILLQASYTLSSWSGGDPSVLPHVFKLEAAWVHEWSPHTNLTLGTSFRAAAGRVRSPAAWDLRAGWTHALTSKYGISATLDVLNLLDRQAATSVDASGAAIASTPPLTLRLGTKLSF